MKKALVIFLLAAFTVSAKVHAQVGIGTTTPDASAQLHFSSTSKGLFIPQITAAQLSAIISPATGLLVYQTDGTPGLLAQDVEKLAKELGYSFDGVHILANSKDHYSLAYSQFIMPLVKSVQEQQIITEMQDESIEKNAGTI